MGLVQEMKNYKQKSYIGLFDGDETKSVAPPSSELYQVALMRESLGLQPISSTQIVKLETENRDLTAKLRKTRIMLNDNTTRLRDMYRKLAKSELLVKDLYLENGRLMRAIKLHFSNHSIADISKII